MEHVHIINTISVPAHMEAVAEKVREEYAVYFAKQEGFVASTFYKSMEREEDGSVRYINTVIWESLEHFKAVVNKGFENSDGENQDGMRVLGRGFPAPIQVSPGRFVKIA